MSTSYLKFFLIISKKFSNIMFKVSLSNWITKPLKTRFSGLPEEVERILGNYHKPASLFFDLWFV
jgi:hypothetical protein